MLYLCACVEGGLERSGLCSQASRWVAGRHTLLLLLSCCRCCCRWTDAAVAHFTALVPLLLL